MYRHVLLFIAAGLLAALPLAAAGSDDTAAAADSDEPVKLVTTFWGGAVKADAFQNSADAYQDANPNVFIELINIPGGEYTNKLLAMIAGGTPPDVININSPLTLELDGMLVELTDKMSDLGYFDPQRGLYDGWFTMLSSDGFYNRGEALYQAPLGTGTTILAFNKRLFDEAGVAHPTADWTWEGEFLEAAKKLSEPDNQWGVNGINRGRFGITGAMPAAWGGAIIDTETMTFTGDSPETLAAMQFMQDLIYEYGAHPTPAEQEAFGGQIGMFENGSAAMYMLHTFEMPTIYDMQDPWDIQFLPQGPAGSWAPLYGGRLAVMASSKHQGHGWEFVNLINGPVGQGFFSISSGFNNPPLQHVANTEEFRAGPEGAPPNNWIRVDALKQAVVTDPIVPNLGRIGTLLDDQLALIWQNEVTPEEAMQSIKEEVQSLLDDGF